MKSGSEFRFKKFTVAHDRSTHKVGTDGVLLGAWVSLENTQRILDVGTGTGLIALMLAQRSCDDVMIDAVEIGEADAEQARENVSRSPWPQKVRVFHQDIQNFGNGYTYDLIVSNPPYFVNSQKPPQARRTHARHTETLTFEELLDAAKRLLGPSGRLAVVLPFVEGKRFGELAHHRGLYPRRVMEFRSREGKPVERLLVEYSGEARLAVREDLVLHDVGESRSEEYLKLTSDFYLDK